MVHHQEPPKLLHHDRMTDEYVVHVVLWGMDVLQLSASMHWPLATSTRKQHEGGAGNAPTVQERTSELENENTAVLKFGPCVAETCGIIRQS